MNENRRIRMALKALRKAKYKLPKILIRTHTSFMQARSHILLERWRMCVLMDKLNDNSLKGQENNFNQAYEKH